MTIDAKELPKVAHLARLSLEAERLEDHAKAFNDLLDLIQEMQGVDTQGVLPMAHPLDATQRLRQDAVTESVDREALQAQAPATEQGLYLVPRVVE